MFGRLAARRYNVPTMPSLEHISDEDLERYHLGMVRDELERAHIRGHLLLCSECANRAKNTANYVNAMRTAMIEEDFDLE